MKPYLLHQYAGNTFIGLGLLDAFAAFGLIITRKNHGETQCNWLGTDDYIVMSCLMLGGILTAWSGRALLRAGDAEYLRDTCTTQHDARSNSNNMTHQTIDEHQITACKTALAASLIFSLMCAYALLGGFHSTPTPESHIGPKTSSDMQLSVFTLIYGLTALFSAIGMVKAAAELGEFNRKKTPSQN